MVRPALLKSLSLRLGLSFSCMLCLFLLLPGCSNSQSAHPTGAVKGKVIAPNGEPLPEGEVSFFSAEMGVGATMPVAADGTFVVPENIRVGKYTVTVTPPPLVPMSPDAPPTKPQDPRRFDTLIPQVYRKELTTPLKDFEVEQKSNDFEIRLENH